MDISKEREFFLNPNVIDENNIPEIWSIYHNAFIEIENIIVSENSAQERIELIQKCLHRANISSGKILAYNSTTSTY